jgi:hypothetical protein
MDSQKIEILYNYLESKGLDLYENLFQGSETSYKVKLNNIELIIGKSSDLNEDNEQLISNTFTYYIINGNQTINNKVKNCKQILKLLKNELEG